MSMRRSPFVLVPALLLVACSSDHPIAGTWKAEAPPAPVVKLALELDDGTDRVMVHLDDPDHRHADATYTFDAATKAVTVKGKLLGDAKADTWTGALAGDVLTLTGGADTLKFKKGGSAH